MRFFFFNFGKRNHIMIWFIAAGDAFTVTCSKLLSFFKLFLKNEALRLP
jgi:hypothetical protein